MTSINDLCRYCAEKLDLTLSKNILAVENVNLLITALQSTPIPISTEDSYPKLVCIDCVLKLNVISEFREKSVSAAKIFDDILSQQVKIISMDDSDMQMILKESDLSDIGIIDEDQAKLDVLASPVVDNEIPMVLMQDSQILGEVHQILTLENEETMNNNPTEFRIINLDLIPEPTTPETITPTKKNPKKKQFYHCELCPEAYQQKRSFEKHMRNVHTEKQTSENESDMIIDPVPEVIPQESAKTPPPENSLIDPPDDDYLDKNKSYKCKLCPKVFNHKKSIARHMKNLHTEIKKNYNCEWCEKDFRIRKELIFHMDTHLAGKSDSCEECGQAFTAIGNFDRTMFIPMTEKPHFCPLCGIRFSLKEPLLHHMHHHSLRSKS